MCDARIGDKRVLRLVKAFLKSGILGEDGELRATDTGAPQGGILSPLLSNIALSVLDEHFVAAWEEMGDSHRREQRRRKGLANYRLVRYADDWVVMVAGDRADAERLRDEAAAVLRRRWGYASRRRRRGSSTSTRASTSWGCASSATGKRGSTKRYVYTYPTRAALASVKAKVKAATITQIDEPVARRPAPPAQPGVARMDRTTTATGQRPRPSPTSPPTRGGGCGLVAAQAPQSDRWQSCDGATPQVVARAGRR